MRRAHHLHVTALVLIATVPLTWLACGGESKPPESPANESSSAASSEEPAALDKAPPASSASSQADTAAAAPTAEATAAAPPPPPSLGATDCGRCIDTTCSKQAAACGKNSDCQSVIDSIHGCSSGAASCIDAATPPTAAKPKKLATAYETCAKKATTAKACKAKCQ
jgi:hypothetical protein